MSIVPIAEALRRLEDDRLVESRARAGTRVRVHTDDDVRELYELREALETQSARLFSQRATPGQRSEIRRLAQQLDVLFSRLAAFDVDEVDVERLLSLRVGRGQGREEQGGNSGENSHGGLLYRLSPQP